MVRALLLTLLALPAHADEEMLACRTLQDAAQRVACYDQLVDQRYSPTVSTQAPAANPPSRQVEPPAQLPDAVRENSVKRTTTKDTTVVTKTTNADSIDEFGKPAKPVSRRSEVSATVMLLDMNARKKLIITLDNQQIWQQLDSSRMRLKSGDTIVIKSSRLGSFKLSKASGGKSIRVKRID